LDENVAFHFFGVYDVLNCDAFDFEANFPAVDLVQNALLVSSQWMLDFFTLRKHTQKMSYA
jgi:hypothetical protein